MNNSKEIANGILRALAIVLAISILLFFLYKVQSVIVYIIIAVVVSLTGRPIVRFLRYRLKFKNTLAVAVTMVLLIGLMVGLVGLFIPLLAEQGHNLSLLNIEQLELSVRDLYNESTSYFGISTNEVEESLKESHLLSKIDYSIIPNFLNALMSGLGNFSIGLFSVLFISFFFLKDSQLFENSLMTLVPDNKESRLKKSIEKIKDLLSR